MKEIRDYLEIKEAELKHLEEKVKSVDDSNAIDFVLSQLFEDVMMLRGEIRGIKECLRYTGMLTIVRN